MGVCQGGNLQPDEYGPTPGKSQKPSHYGYAGGFLTDDGLLFKWGKFLNADKMVEAYGVVPGEFMNTGFLTLKPISIMVNKYVDLINDPDEPDSMSNFITIFVFLKAIVHRILEHKNVLFT